MALYDKYYKKDKNYFGNAHPPLIEYFSSSYVRGSVVDLGAGQGRNSIPLYKLGYNVTAVDISQVGLDQIQSKYHGIKTLCNDIYNFDTSEFDFILLDSMLHFYKNDFNREKEFVEGILNQMKINSTFINCMIYSHHKHLVNLVKSFTNLQILMEDTFYYSKNVKYHMIVVKKIK